MKKVSTVNSIFFEIFSLFFCFFFVFFMCFLTSCGGEFRGSYKGGLCRDDFGLYLADKGNEFFIYGKFFGEIRVI